MKTLGNILWLILGGLLVTICYWLVGLLFCITIIGIPFGIQLFKLGAFALHPFGKDFQDGKKASGCTSIAMNILWVLLGGWETASIHFGFGVACALTIIGLPFAKQHFKMMVLAIFPFGKEIIDEK